MKVDMSPQAVKNRLKLVSEFWRLSISLGKTKEEMDARRNIKSIFSNVHPNDRRK